MLSLAKGAAGALALIPFLLTSATAPTPTGGLAVLDETKPARLVRLPDGRHLNFRCMGAGSPTVIFEGGYAATSTAWVKVQPALSRDYRTCSYDRAGYGFSDPGPEPRDGAEIAADLDAGLRAARIQGPYVLVGHSAGGLYIRAFERRRPSEVVGLVFVDPSVAFQDTRMAERFGPGAGSFSPLLEQARRCLKAASAGALPSRDPALQSCAPRSDVFRGAEAIQLAQAEKPSTWRTRISELEALFTSTSEEVSGPPDLGDRPVIVLTADLMKTGPSPRAVDLVNAYWSSLHQEIATLSRRGAEERVAGAGHLLMLERPDLVIAAVHKVAERASASRR